MTYQQLMELSKTQGVVSDDKMWMAVNQMSKDLDDVREKDEKQFERIMRHQHEVIYEGHYSEQMANADVNRLEYQEQTDGEVVCGPHWTCSQIAEATKTMTFPAKVNNWDRYVAFNVMYAHLCNEMTEDCIIRAAYLFFFGDGAWKHNDCTKVWDYMTFCLCR